PEEAPEEAPKKDIKDMTSEEIQALRRQKKAAESGQPEAPPVPGKAPADDSFELPADPLDR
ncbi:MAG: hypothetical protein HN719_04100, partial [Alphaproteobacteria bacterium]|nr:hypothetical protein [Alphaproteobacteria bacterium]